MSGPQILYGVRDGKLIHVDDANRGQACNCICYQCRRPLVAKKGEILTHFFAHEASDVNCNPTPESLLHRYAKEQVAKMGRLGLPGFAVEGRYETPDRTVHSLHWRYLPTYDVDIALAEVESHQHVGVVPDVLISDTDSFSLAVEVYYRHAVDLDKLEKLKRLPFSAVEVDLSDLPVTTSSANLNAALRQGSRWTWLHNRYQLAHQSRLTQRLENALGITKIQPPSKQPITSNSTIPSRMIADASSKAVAALAAQLSVKLKVTPVSEMRALLHDLSRELRLALHCHWIGVSPMQLPGHLMQSVTRQSVFGPIPAILWQTGVFAKFCMAGTEPITAQQAAFWVRRVFPGLHKTSALYSTSNNLNEYSEATFNFLNHLAEQGLLDRIRSRRPWEATFRPMASTRAEVRAHLLEFPPAERRRPD